MDCIGFGKLSQNIADPRFERKIAEYGDMRVSPHGVVSVRERQQESRARYGEHMRARGSDPDAYFDMLAAGGEELERQIFAHCDIRPEDLTDASIASVLERLRETIIP
jgi:hypothetical protein